MSAAAELVVGLPFNTRIGMVAEDGESLALADDPTLTNHVGTVHAGALFTLGEAASGVAITEAVAALGAMPIAKGATIAYRRPAKGRVRARGRIVEELEAIRARLRTDGKTAFDVAVSITDAEGVEVATMTVTWHLRGGG
jgi:acyl-coenzyme A thioesterase PaaI-like protein